MLKCSKPTMANITPAKQQQVSIVIMTMLASSSKLILELKTNCNQGHFFFSSLGWIVGNVLWEDLEELWVFSNDSSGALKLNCWVWRSLAKQSGSLYQISVVANPVRPPAAFMVKLHRGTATRAVCVWSCDFASGTNTDGHQRERRSVFFMWQCNVCV